jgi:hypothetical protein
MNVAADATPVRDYQTVAEGYWIGIECFLGSQKGTDVPPLISRGDPGRAAFGSPGALGSPGATLAFGNERVNTGLSPGIRLGAGFFLGSEQRWSVDANMTSLQEVKTTFTATTDATSAVYIPATLPPFGGFTGGPISFPLFGVALTSATAVFDSRFTGADTNLRYGLILRPDARLDILVGYRYMHLIDNVSLDTTVVNPPFGVPVNFSLDSSSSDTFRTRNDFHGLNLGMSGFKRFGKRFTIQGRGTVGLGQTFSTTDIYGSTQTPRLQLSPLFPFNQGPTGGIFTKPTNSGTYHSANFAVVPEAGVQIGYELTERLRSTVGFTYQYWSNVRRAADQIDTVVGLPPLLPAPFPKFLDRSTDFSLRGLTLGLNLSY